MLRAFSLQPGDLDSPSSASFSFTESPASASRLGGFPVPAGSTGTTLVVDTPGQSPQLARKHMPTQGPVVRSPSPLRAEETHAVARSLSTPANRVQRPRLTTNESTDSLGADDIETLLMRSLPTDTWRALDTAPQPPHVPDSGASSGVGPASASLQPDPPRAGHGQAADAELGESSPRTRAARAFIPLTVVGGADGARHSPMLSAGPRPHSPTAHGQSVSPTPGEQGGGSRPVKSSPGIPTVTLTMPGPADTASSMTSSASASPRSSRAVLGLESDLGPAGMRHRSLGMSSPRLPPRPVLVSSTPAPDSPATKRASQPSPDPSRASSSADRTGSPCAPRALVRKAAVVEDAADKPATGPAVAHVLNLHREGSTSSDVDWETLDSTTV